MASAQAPIDTLRLADAIGQARSTNPGLRGTRLRADAASERVPQAGALPDRDAGTPVGGLVLPAVGGEIASVDSLLAIASEQRPALQAAHERTRAAAAGYQAARRELFPDIMVSLAYGQRPQFDVHDSMALGTAE